MALTNANLETKKILRALPQDPEPTIAKMVEACTKAASMEQTVAFAGKNISLDLMADTGADVTIVPQAEWPRDWELVSPCGTISGVGGAVNSRRSKHLVCVEGPEGQVATIRPFVVASNIKLLGRDVLSQWGARLDIPSPAWDF
ncbi:endogenous retrovirus group K member 6 Pro protein-like [Vidua chalybeata]|uniref:endogenous retrovirus group K member 6 Pro protein-like n=3 Tax=Vidua TaxID=37613 RepID=UPI0023A8DEBB|nr:endogenous retrovirus group K member 6 Pro protein-like [Vidua chalybeata]